MIEVKKKIRAKLSLRSFKSTAENLRERLKTGDNHPAQNMFMVRCVTISQKKKTILCEHYRVTPVYQEK